MWYANCASGLEVFDVEREQSPIELRWLVYPRRVKAPDQSPSRWPAGRYPANGGRAITVGLNPYRGPVPAAP